ncbi:MAG: tape measure protein [Anaerolineae bacterium]
MAANGIDLQRLVVKIDAQTDDLEKGLKETEKSVEGWISGLKGFMVEAGANIVGNVVTPAVQAVMGIGGEAFDVVSGHERLTASLQAMLAKEINAKQGLNDLTEATKRAVQPTAELTKWIQQVAIKSPFSKEGVAQSIQQAMAFGFTADQAKKMTQTLVDWASGAGKSEDAMGRVAVTLGQIQAKGKLSGEELMQLTEAGIGQTDIFNEMARITGKSTGQLQDMVSKGLIPADLAIRSVTQALDRDFAGAAERQSGTLEGVVNSLGDLRQEMLRLAFTPFFQAIQPYLVQFADALQDPKIQQGIANIGTWLGEMTTKGIEKVVEFAGRVKEAFNVFRQTEGMGAGTRAYGIASALGLDENGAQMVERAVNIIATAFTYLQQAIAFVREHATAFQIVFGAIVSFLIGNAVAAGIMAIVGGFMTFAGVITSVVSGIGFAIAAFQSIAGVIGLVQIVVAALGGPITVIIGLITFFALAWMNNWFGIRDITAQVMNFLTSIISTGLALIQGWWSQNGEVIMRVVNVLWTSVVGEFQRGLADSQAQVMTVLAAIQSFWQAHREQVMAVVNFFWEAIKGYFQLSLDNLVSIFKLFDAAQRGDWEAFGREIRAIWDRTWAAVQTAFETAKNVLANLASQAASGIKQKFTEIDWGQVGKDIITGIGNGLSSAMNWLKEKAQPVSQKRR